MSTLRSTILGKMNAAPSQGLPLTVRAIYADRANPSLYLSGVEAISRARWAYLSKRGAVQRFDAKLQAYVVLV